MPDVLKHKTLAAAPGAISAAEWDEEHTFAGGADGQVLAYSAAASDKAVWADRARVLHVGVTALGTDANTSEKDLQLYTIPANTLSANGKTLRFTAAGSVGANGNAKTIRLRFNSTVMQIYSAGTANGLTWRLVAEIARRGANLQVGTANLNMGPTFTNHVLSAPTADVTGPIDAKITGQNGSAVANDVICDLFLVELLN